MNPEHYQGTVMRSEPQYATDESWEGEGSSEAESGYVMQFLSLGVEMGVVSKKMAVFSSGGYGFFVV